MSYQPLGDELVAEGYGMSSFAQELLNSGFEGNGCGCGFFSFRLATLAQKIFKVDYSYSCLIHDAEWSIADEHKNHNHRIDSNAKFEMNLILDSCEDYGEGLTKNKIRLAAWFHGIVTLNTDGYNDE